MARSISPQEELIGWWREDLDPRRHITAERKSEKLSRHLSQLMILLYGFYYYILYIYIFASELNLVDPAARFRILRTRDPEIN